ncbi:PTS sugar transporter subunit IIA [Virgibacillus flavescens]|uniref:PTS sugar transporter subunit IIA n=1 Tax=Virgibacillus flavescens TaxID=1611422 RepID=UPI003D3526F1
MGEVFFDESVILLDVEGSTKEDILTVMSRNLEEKKLVKSSFTQAIIARENEFATGLPTGGCSVAIPHTDFEHVNQKAISIAILKEQVEFGVMGDESETTPVKVVFMLAMDKADEQLPLLQKLMQVFQHADTLKYLASERDKTAIKQVVKDRLGIAALKGGE